jgi:hypothetical protein
MRVETVLETMRRPERWLTSEVHQVSKFSVLENTFNLDILNAPHTKQITQEQSAYLNLDLRQDRGRNIVNSSWTPMKGSQGLASRWRCRQGQHIGNGETIDNRKKSIVSA